jgi:hypothetical protein
MSNDTDSVLRMDSFAIKKKDMKLTLIYVNILLVYTMVSAVSP